ncbi:helix-turn-helix domain-containing protein [Caulobacter hibisci]|uniref:Helix-turn-helix transcriptional regulator n=1 Tax=Caulobacter hibisci TaxID=2035993 RepID=A0ABS0T4I4_9CAUL|nr:helix-turn-helix transcriptional regulator [Caulobacter hibisci]MBI1686795.1 helix-turn-helix transcriptional regulator [Caulobacter hibisci]
MVRLPASPLARQGRLLSRIVKLLREERNLTSRQTAARMKMQLRTYQDFEAGKREFSFTKVRRFARGVGADPFGILLAMYLHDPEAALEVMDNRMPMAFYVGMRRLRKAIGAELATIPPAQVLLAMRRVEEELLAYLARRAAGTEDWLEQAFAEILDDPPDDDT